MGHLQILNNVKKWYYENILKQKILKVPLTEEIDD